MRGRLWRRVGAAAGLLAIVAAADAQDGRAVATLRMEARDAGIVLRSGNGPGRCDELGARDVWVWEHSGRYYMHYDGAGPTGWLACLAESRDLLHWTKRGPALGLGAPGSADGGSASYGITVRASDGWHMFYLGTPNTSPAPDRVPAFPYLVMKATGPSPTGPWRKRPEVVPFRPQPGYTEVTASPGHVIRRGDEWWMYFSAAGGSPVLRTLALARTRDLNGPWTVPDAPILPRQEQIENSAIYYEPANGMWFLFTNHVGITRGVEHTDAVWVYWSRDPARWDPAQKAIVLDGRNCGWSKTTIGLPSVVRVGKRLALFYDGCEDPGDLGHMRRHIGLAWLNLPLKPPTAR